MKEQSKIFLIDALRLLIMEVKNYKLPEIESIKEIFHCHPYSSSEKGSIENAHRLLRRYIEKVKSIDKYIGQDLKPIADFINSHP